MLDTSLAVQSPTHRSTALNPQHVTAHILVIGHDHSRAGANATYVLFKYYSTRNLSELFGHDVQFWLQVGEPHLVYLQGKSHHICPPQALRSKSGEILLYQNQMKVKSLKMGVARSQRLISIVLMDDFLHTRNRAEWLPQQ